VGKGVFDIDIFRLANGEHSFEFNFDSTFFGLFEDSVIENGRGTIKIDLNRTPSLITLNFHLDGEIELVCDRSLDTFMYPISETNEVRIKYGDHWEELSEELYLIPTDTQKIDVGQFVYEFISLAIPMKKLHPRFQDDDEDGFIFSSSDREQESSKSPIDPRWNELKKLKKN
jgi:uncharacterized metal-binding protein YceD (DUF177 family)